MKKALTDNALYRVRGVPGVRWAVPLYKGIARALAPDGKFRQVVLLGIDDASLVGAPRRMLLGRYEDLKDPIIDWAGYAYFFPGRPLAIGQTFEFNDHRARLVGIAEASAPFATFPVFFTRYTQALRYVGRERNLLSYVLVKADAPVTEVAARIQARTGLSATTTEGFSWQTIAFYLANTGIPVNFGITIALAFLVGAVVAGQTFYLFTLENLKHYGALKAIGVTDLRLIGMILLQALVVGSAGYALGMGIAAAFFEITSTICQPAASCSCGRRCSARGYGARHHRADEPLEPEKGALPRARGRVPRVAPWKCTRSRCGAGVSTRTSATAMRASRCCAAWT
jgi:putative ABC transport system permease protein